MPSLGEILRRFRFHGVPGAPAVVGVPADRTGELEAELVPVFSALQETQDRASTMLAEAERDAARWRADALGQGRRIIAEARAGAGTARAEAAAARLAQARSERARLLTAANTEADRIERVTAERAPALVNEVVRRVLAFGGPTETLAGDWTDPVGRDPKAAP